MLARLGSVAAARRVVRYGALFGAGGREASASSEGGNRALPGSQRRCAAGAGSAGSGDAECFDATWSEVKGTADEAYVHAQPAPFAVPARAQQICEAYRATDPVRPRPGLYLHLQA